MDFAVYPASSLVPPEPLQEDMTTEYRIERDIAKLRYYYAAMELIYDRLLKMKHLETAVVDSAFSIDFSPAFQQLIHTHENLKVLFISEYQEHGLPKIFEFNSFMSANHEYPQIYNKDYMKHTTEILVAEDNVFTTDYKEDVGNFLHRSNGRYDYELNSYYIPILTQFDLNNLDEHPDQNPSEGVFEDRYTFSFTTNVLSSTVASAPRIMSRIDIEGMRKNYTSAFANGFEYYYNKTKTNWLNILREIEQNNTEDKATLQPEGQAAEWALIDKERIHRNICLATAYKEQVPGF